MLKKFELDAVVNRLEGWELVEYLQISIEDVLASALAEEWINETNYKELLELVGFTEDDTFED